jgi:hypothetical protein
MIEEHYDNENYDNTIIFLNRLPSIEDNIYYTPYKKRIYYMLEHKTTDADYWNSIYCVWDNYYIDLVQNTNITEMWTMDYRPQFAIRCEQELGIPFKYVPMRYTSLIKPIENIYLTPKTVDFCLVGLLSKSSPQRIDILNEVETNHSFSFKGITQVKDMQAVISEMNTSRYILDIPREYTTITQNQVRIFELLCMGYTVCAKKMYINIFPGLIYEWETIDDLINIVKKGEYLHPIETYKEMTYTDEAYEKYVNNLINIDSYVK